MRAIVTSLIGMTMLAGCNPTASTSGDADNQGTSAPAATVRGTIPASLAPSGEGYPNPGDPCRTLGESDATRNWLDHTQTLVGCPDKTSAAALKGKEVATVDGAILVSLPRQQPAGRPVEDMPDAVVPGTSFHATSQISCSFNSGKTGAMCDAGVTRAQSDDDFTTVEVTKPDGSKRILSFKGTKPIGGDGTQADGAAGYTFKATRSGDDTLIEYGPERFVVPDALVVGG